MLYFVCFLERNLFIYVVVIGKFHTEIFQNCSFPIIITLLILVWILESVWGFY